MDEVDQPSQGSAHLLQRPRAPGSSDSAVTGQAFGVHVGEAFANDALAVIGVLWRQG